MTDFRPDRQPLVPPGGIDAHTRDMTVTAAADVPLRVLQDRLAAAGQWLPVDGDPDAPLGRLVEENSTGPLRLGYGAWRDLLLGVQFTNGRGELVTAGGRTVKNVAGYDLTKFMVGSRGVFGRLVTLTTRTYRRPDRAIVAQFAPDPGVVSRLLPTPIRPHWAVLTADTLWCGYLGDVLTLDYYRAQVGVAFPLEAWNRTPEEDVAHRHSLWRSGGADGFRAAVPPLRVTEFVKAAGVAGWAADPAFGVVVGPLASESQRQPVREAAAAAGGTVIFSTPRPDGSAAAELSATPAERLLVERLKVAFDPDRRLAPLPW